jgi:hypothetical protein
MGVLTSVSEDGKPQRYDYGQSYDRALQIIAQ